MHNDAKRPDPSGDLAARRIPWPARVAIAAIIGAGVAYVLICLGFMQSRSPSTSMNWAIIGSGALAASLLAIRPLRTWYAKIITEGIVIAVAVVPIAVLTILINGLTGKNTIFPGIGKLLEFFVVGLMFGAQVLPITVIYGIVAGGAYYFAMRGIECILAAVRQRPSTPA
jgi:hypothetical protein